MRTILPLLLLLLCNPVHAAPIPLSPELQNRLETDIIGSAYNVQKMAVAVYDAAAVGGASTAAIGLGTSLPANAVVTSGRYIINTALTDNGAATYQFKCGSTSLMGTAIDMSTFSANAVKSVGAGQSTGSFTDIGTSPCEISMQTALSSGSGTLAVTAGKVTLFVDYFIHQ